jgi:hypothetical protein
LTFARDAGKDTAVIFDGLDRLLDPTKFWSVVQEDLRLFRELKVSILVTAPLSVLFAAGVGQSVSDHFDRVHHLPVISDDPDKGSLLSVLKKRRGYDLLSAAEADFICWSSGGVPRDKIAHLDRLYLAVTQALDNLLEGVGPKPYDAYSTRGNENENKKRKQSSRFVRHNGLSHPKSKIANPKSDDRRPASPRSGSAKWSRQSLEILDQHRVSRVRTARESQAAVAGPVEIENPVRSEMSHRLRRAARQRLFPDVTHAIHAVDERDGAAIGRPNIGRAGGGRQWEDLGRFAARERNYWQFA